MSEHEKSEDRRQLMTQYERGSISSSWLLRELGKKIKYFPRDLSRRLRRSYNKRYSKNYKGPANPAKNLMHLLPAGAVEPFVVADCFRETFQKSVETDATFKTLVDEIDRFKFSDEMDALVAQAAALEPEIGELSGHEGSVMPHWHDGDYQNLINVSQAIPEEKFDAVVLMPAGRMGGADLVAAILSQALATRDRVLVLRTDDTHWDRPDWFPDTVTSIDISQKIQGLQSPTRALYVILSAIDAPRIYNVNSRLAFETFVEYGSQLAARYRLYAYYFCSDRTPSGVEVGYPVSFFWPIFKHLTAAMIDTKDLAQTLRQRYSIPADEAGKVVTLYTPAQTEMNKPNLACEQVKRATSTTRRKHILWAGRLDRQKRFDLVIEVARLMPDVDFSCWGKAVLDAAPDMSKLPANVTVNPPFSSYDDLPLSDCDGWFYTSEWDGLPTILIELGAYGMPIAASAVGGVPELVDETTGWNFPGDAPASDIASTLHDMLDNPQARIDRATALQARVTERHGMADYTADVLKL